MSKTVVMRCNASSDIGMGQLERCREIARELQKQKHRAIMVGPSSCMKIESDNELFSHWYPVKVRGSSYEDSARVIKVCKDHHAKHLIMDDYRADTEYQLRLRGSDIRFSLHYDASRPCPFHADLLVNASPYEQRAEYLRWLADPLHTKTLFGPAYAVLRPEFLGHPALTSAASVRRILVCFGGGNDRGGIDVALDALAGNLPAGIELQIITGPLNPRLPDVLNRISGLRGVDLRINPSNMAKLLRESDLALIGGGTMSYEAAICGVPMVLVAVAPNQINSCLGWQSLSGAPYLGTLGDISPDSIRTSILRLIEDKEKRLRISEIGREAVDGKGTRRIVSELLELSETYDT